MNIKVHFTFVSSSPQWNTFYRHSLFFSSFSSVPLFQPFDPIYCSGGVVTCCATCMSTPGGSTMKEDSPRPEAYTLHACALQGRPRHRKVTAAHRKSGLVQNPFQVNIPSVFNAPHMTFIWGRELKLNRFTCHLNCSCGHSCLWSSIK